MAVRDATYVLERRLHRAGLGPVGGADEAGRGACAGPLVAGAAVLDPRPSRAIEGLRDSKFLSAQARERLYDVITSEAVAWAVVAIPAAEVDRLGIHEANLQALRRALLRLDTAVGYALTDGFPVAGIGCPGLAVWKGDAVASCVAAASILAKVTRDRSMVSADEQFPGYGFALHKGYSTASHQAALERLGPSPLHRMSYANVAQVAGLRQLGGRGGKPQSSAGAGARGEQPLAAAQDREANGLGAHAVQAGSSARETNSTGISACLG